MKRLAHDLDTLTRVYLTISQIREEYDQSCWKHYEAGDYEAGKNMSSQVIALGNVLNVINDMIDENWSEQDFNDPSEIYREPDETSAVAFDGNDLPF